MTKQLTPRTDLHPYRLGFTIVELLIVVVVIAILAAITIVSYNGITKQAKEASLNSDLRNNVTAIENDKAVVGSYPTAAPNLTSSSENNVSYFYSKFTPNYYCVQAINGTLRRYHQSSDGTTKAGVCPAPASVIAIKGSAAPGSSWYVALSLQSMQAGSYRARCTIDGAAFTSYNTYTFPTSGVVQLACTLSSANAGKSVSVEIEGLGLATPTVW